MRRYKLVPKQNAKIIALGGGTNRIAAMETGAVDAALIEAPYNVMLERRDFGKFSSSVIWFPLPWPASAREWRRFKNSRTKSSAWCGLQIAMEEIRAELKLDTPPDHAKAFDFRFV